MDIMTILGVVIAFGSIILGYIISRWFSTCITETNCMH